MSNKESKFIQLFSAIAAALIIASIIGLVGMYRAFGIMSVKVKGNENKIIELMEYHEKDVELIRSNIKEIKSDQKVILTDIKQILHELK
jgi:hypothetical protein